MKRRSNGLAKAVVGVVLAGGALGAIFWWNRTAIYGTAQASPPPTALVVAPPSSPSPSAPASTVGAATSSGTALTLLTPGTSSAGPASAPPVPLLTTGSPPSTRPLSATAVAPVAPAPVTATSPTPLVDGKKLLDAGKLVEGRKLLNDALNSGQLKEPGDVSAAKAMIREANRVLVYSPQRIEGDPYVDVVTIQKGDRLTKIANDHFCTYEMILKINGLDSDRRLRPGQQLKVLKGPMHAVVDKRAFTLDLYLGAPGGPDSMYINTYRVGLGTDNSTPTGLWRVERGNKLKNPTYYSPRGEGVIAAGDPANPLGPYWIGLTGAEGNAVGKTSYGIHGTIHPDSIGKMESMGCIRLVNDDIAQVFISLYEVKSTVRVVE